MIDDDEAMLVESVIVLGEVFKISESAGVSDSAERERKLEAIRSLIQSRKVLLQDVSLPIINKATEYRLSQKMRLPDAIHLATAVLNRCDWLVTLDRDFKHEYGIQIFRLEDIRNNSSKLPWESGTQYELFAPSDTNVVQLRK